ncbi:hypothetical protein [Pedobacter nyackensis]|uniref:Uncharacterized protein n=1 Tax=Pedobacter nyackensis TaxID=475255 RepID=A0A1W2B529_9SPHI|nr:hypothetical protein [Pedobacter nyackensis]SMC68105.1 hypothetical protein SAMN04488101_102125 [Pedobacter nyackensis]
MKKILLLIICSFGAIWASGQGKVTLSPAAFTSEDEVTITLDVTGTPLAGANDVYVWAFSNDGVGGGKDASTNGQWAASSEDAKMTKTATNIFTFKFTATTLFGQSPAELINFGFLAKSKDGSKQTPDYKPFKFDPLVFTASQFRLFPAKLDYTDMATVYFHQNLATDVNLQRMTNIKVSLSFYNEAGDPVGSKQNIVTVKESAILFSYSFIPERVITFPAATKLGKFSYQFTGTVKDANGLDVTTNGPVTEVVYTVFN